MGQDMSRAERQRLEHDQKVKMWQHTGAVPAMYTSATANFTTTTGARTPSTAPMRRAPLKSDTERVILWEVSIAKGCLNSFNNMLTAHAIVLSLLFAVNLMSFCQPPRGWAGDSGRMFSRSKPLIAFSFFNSVSLYTATSGLLFYIYCSHSAIISLQWVPLPDRFDDALSVNLLHNLRASFHHVTLPSLQRRCALLFFLMAGSLTSCMIAYICAGYAATSPGVDRFIGVILPAFFGCIGMLVFLSIAAAKLALELDFDTRLKRLWSNMGGAQIPNPEVRTLHKDDMQALDPLPPLLSWWYHSPSRSRVQSLNRHRLDEIPLHSTSSQGL